MSLESDYSWVCMVYEVTPVASDGMRLIRMAEKNTLEGRTVERVAHRIVLDAQIAAMPQSKDRVDLVQDQVRRGIQHSRGNTFTHWLLDKKVGCPIPRTTHIVATTLNQNEGFVTYDQEDISPLIADKLIWMLKKLADKDESIAERVTTEFLPRVKGLK